MRNQALKLTLLALSFQLSAFSRLDAQKVQWTDIVYVPGRWQGGRLVRAAVGAPADSLALVMRVDYFGHAPRWRAEIRHSPDGQNFDDPTVLLGNGATVLVVTPVGTTPLAQHAAGRDTLVRAAAAVMSAGGVRTGASSGRITESGAAGVSRVVFRRSARSATFDDKILDPRNATQGAQFIASRLTSVGDQRSASVVATAGARGVDNVQTPGGNIPVTPDTMAVVRMERFSVGALKLEDFMRLGNLGAYKPAAPDSTARDTTRRDTAVKKP